jgi:hypothetical protein
MIQAANVLHMIKRYVGIEKDGREWLLEMMPKHSVCAEIGVFWGMFSRLILKIVEPKILHLIDPWLYQPDPSLAQALYGGVSGSQKRMDQIHDNVVRHLGHRKNVTIHRVPSLTAVNQFSDNSFDWIYVDGDHSYEGATADLERYRSKVKPGGFVAGDDYARNPNGWMQDSVTRAVDDIIARGLYEEVELCQQTHQFILRKP